MYAFELVGLAPTVALVLCVALFLAYLTDQITGVANRGGALGFRLQVLLPIVVVAGAAVAWFTLSA